MRGEVKKGGVIQRKRKGGLDRKTEERESG
jgi:hypothetical protein